MLVCHWQKIMCNTCKDISNDFASHSFVGWLSLRIVSSAVIYQSAFCVILIHMLISVVKSIILAFWTLLHLAIWEYLSASAREVCTLQVLLADLKFYLQQITVTCKVVWKICTCVALYFFFTRDGSARNDPELLGYNDLHWPRRSAFSECLFKNPDSCSMTTLYCR